MEYNSIFHRDIKKAFINELFRISPINNKHFICTSINILLGTDMLFQFGGELFYYNINVCRCKPLTT